MSGYVEGRIRAQREWAAGLATLTVAAEIEPFEPGQFVNLALRLDASGQPSSAGSIVHRSYSIASAPGSPLEFLVTRVAGGAFTPALFDRPVGESLLVESKPQGFFRLSYVPETARELWMIATGTGLGPYVSMLRTETTWARFERFVVVHGARLRAHLSHRDELEAASHAHGDRLSYVPLVSREDPMGGLAGRIPSAIESGEVEARAKLTLSADRSHVLLCGNPDMIQDTTRTLGARGLRKHRPRAPGHVSFEKYW